MTFFEYDVVEDVLVRWHLTVSGYDDEIDGDLDIDQGYLSDVEIAIEDLTADYRETTGARLTHVRGDHGWRELKWDNGAMHRYEWEHFVMDLRCENCRGHSDLFMLTKEVWESAGLEGWVCFRCIEAALGRRLTPADFEPGIPANDDTCLHEPELRERLGLPD
ncbi:hypothetical protein [Nocardia xishanensis]